MSKPEQHIVQLIHPDYPTPVGQLNEAYERHTEQVQVILQRFVNLKLPESQLTQLLGDMAAVIDEVSKIHQPYANTKWYQRRCAGCGNLWPCRTAQTLDRAGAANFFPAIDTEDKKP